MYEGHSISSANSHAFFHLHVGKYSPILINNAINKCLLTCIFHLHVGKYSPILINNAINKCLRVKQTCVRSAILAVLIRKMHEGRLKSNANAYEGKSN